MKRFFTPAVIVMMSLSAVMLITAPAPAAIDDLTTWTLVEDPPHANFSSDTPTANAITLHAANGPIPTATDIGYQSVNGNTAAASTAGYAFDPNTDFRVSINFDLSFADSGNLGGLAIGFGIGEDINGDNSAGAAMFSLNGFLVGASGAARISNTNQAALPLSHASLDGRFFVDYDASSGDITVGVGATDSDFAFASTATYAAIQNSWTGSALFPAFFLRSDNLGIFSAWTSGAADAVFSDFSVDLGSPTQVPEPASLTFLALSGVALFRRRR